MADTRLPTAEAHQLVVFGDAAYGSENQPPGGSEKHGRDGNAESDDGSASKEYKMP